MPGDLLVFDLYFLAGMFAFEVLADRERPQHLFVAEKADHRGQQPQVVGEGVDGGV